MAPDSVGADGERDDGTFLSPEEMREEADRRFRFLGDHGGRFVFQYRIVPDPGFLYVSPASLRVLGVSPEEFLINHARLISLVHPEDRPAVEDALCAGSDAERSCPLRFVRPDGHEIRGELHCLRRLLPDRSVVTEGVFETETPHVSIRLVEPPDIVEGAETIDRFEGALQTLRACLATAMELSDMECGGVFVIDPATGEAELICRVNLSEALVAWGAAGSDAGGDAPRFFGDAPEDAPLDPDLVREEITAAARVPFSFHDEVVGWLVLATRAGRDVSQETRDTLAATAGLLGYALASMRARLELDESEKRFEELADSLPEVVFEYDLQGRFIYANRTGFEIFGYSLEDMEKGISVGDLLTEESRAEAQRNMMRVLSGETSTGNEYTVRTKDGRVFPVIVSARPIRADGKIVGARGIMVDISDRRAAERELRLARFTLDHASDAIFWFTPDGAFRYVNEAACAFLGYTRDELLDLGVGDIDPTVTDEELAKLRDMLGREDAAVVTTRQRRKDGAMLPVEVTCNRLVFEGTEYICAFVRDMRERIEADAERDRLEEQLRQSQKMEAIGQLAGGIAHDFNNLLGGIVSFSELIRLAGDDATQRDQYVTEILSTCDRAVSLVGQLLTFARKGRYEFVPVDVHAVVKEAVALLEHTIDRRIDIHCELGAETPIVSGDANHLQQAFLNLGLNARDAMPDGGLLVFSTHDRVLDEEFCSGRSDLSPGPHLEVRVADTGVGIPDDVAERIFEPFFTTKAKGKGTGMGLAGTYGSVARHGGHIEFSSVPDEGTVFSVFLPVSEDIDLDDDDERIEEDLIRGTGVVLVADDELVMRDSTADMLDQLGYTTILCEDGRRAVDTFRERRDEIDLVMLDMLMPGLNGLDAFREMRAIDPEVRCLAVTGFAVRDAISSMLNEGATAALYKPYRLVELSRAVDEAMRAAPGEGDASD